MARARYKTRARVRDKTRAVDYARAWRQGQG